MKFLSEFVIENDSFGSEKKFKINGKEKFQTFFGGFLNIGIFFIFFFKFLSLFIKFTKGTGPNLAISEDIDPNPIQYNSGEEVISIFGSKDFDKNIFNISEYFHVSAYKYDFKNYSQEELNISTDLESNLAIKIPEGKTINLTGTFGDLDFNKNDKTLNVIMI